MRVHQDELHPNGLSRYNDIAHLLPFTRQTLWRKIKKGAFPRPERLSQNMSVWKNSDILAWLDNPSAWSESK